MITLKQAYKEYKERKELDSIKNLYHKVNGVIRLKPEYGGSTSNV
jgi:hypothetical protein